VVPAHRRWTTTAGTTVNALPPVHSVHLAHGWPVWSSRAYHLRIAASATGGRSKNESVSPPPAVESEALGTGWRCERSANPGSPAARPGRAPAQSNGLTCGGDSLRLVEC
jgi:hypothetical protein